MSEIIRIQPLGGQWETLGADRLRGIVPEGIVASSNDWGPDAMSFTMKAEAGARRPDLLPFTPIELEIDGDIAWAGYTWQRPADSNGYQVTCRGWQYHLDDDLFDRVWVHTRLADWRDQRTFLTAVLADFHVAGVVSNDRGAILLGWPQGAVVANGHRVGVTLDLGSTSVAQRIVFKWATTNNTGTATVNVRGTDTESTEEPGETISTFAINAAASGTTAASFSTARRFVHFFVLSTAGQTFGADVHVQLQSVQVFRGTAYESGNASILKADAPIRDALGFAPLLNQSQARISAGTFNLPEYLTGGYITPRAVMEAVNALENYRLKIGGDDLRTLVYDLKPSQPLTEVGEWSGSEFSDATVSGEPIYNKAIVDATGPDGARLVAQRGVIVAHEIAKQVATNNNPWTAPVQMGLFARGVSLVAGLPYRVDLGDWSQTGGSTAQIRCRLGGNATNNPALPPDDYIEWSFVGFVDSDMNLADGSTTVTPQTWIPKRAYTQLVREDYLTAGSISTYVLGHTLGQGTTIPDLRSFVRSQRLDVSAAVTQAVAERIADLWLTEHVTAPFTGTLKVVGSGARWVATSQSVRPHQYLLQAGEKIRLAHRIDPDTGAQGRDGRIAAVTYNHGDRSVEISIDDQRQKFETILSRYAALVGG